MLGEGTTKKKHNIAAVTVSRDRARKAGTDQEGTRKKNQFLVRIFSYEIRFVWQASHLLRLWRRAFAAIPSASSNRGTGSLSAAQATTMQAEARATLRAGDRASLCLGAMKGATVMGAGPPAAKTDATQASCLAWGYFRG